MSDLSVASGYAAQKVQHDTHLKILILLLFLTASVTLAVPAIDSSVFDALSTDDAMRLVEVSDWIGGQGWFDVVQIEWIRRAAHPCTGSRLIDAPLAGLILLLKPLLGMRGAEALILYFWPALLFAAALALVAAIARQMSNSNRTDRPGDSGSGAGRTSASGPRPFPRWRDRSPQRADRLVARVGPDDGTDRAKRRQGCAGRPDGIAVAGDRLRNAACHRCNRCCGIRPFCLAWRTRCAAGRRLRRGAGGILAPARAGIASIVVA